MVQKAVFFEKVPFFNFHALYLDEITLNQFFSDILGWGRPELNTMPPTVGFSDMFLYKISTLKFSVTDGLGSTTLATITPLIDNVWLVVCLPVYLLNEYVCICLLCCFLQISIFKMCISLCGIIFQNVENMCIPLRI